MLPRQVYASHAKSRVIMCHISLTRLNREKARVNHCMSGGPSGCEGDGIKKVFQNFFFDWVIVINKNIKCRYKCRE